MATFTLDAYPNSVAITLGTASLASTTADPPAGRQSTVVDNATNKFLDAIVGGKITTGTTPTASRQIIVMAYGGVYDGTTVTYPANATGSDGNLTPYANWKGSFRTICVIDTSGDSDRTYGFGPIGIAQFFGGILPIRWGLFVYHNTGVALNATAGNHEFRYQGIKLASA